MISLILAKISVILAIISAVSGLVFILRWYDHARRNNKTLLTSMQKKSIFNKFVDPKKFFPYCFRRDKKDDEISALLKRKYIFFMILWFVLAFIAFVLYKA